MNVTKKEISKQEMNYCSTCGLEKKRELLISEKNQELKKKRAEKKEQTGLISVEATNLFCRCVDGRSKLYEELGIENSECDWFSFSEKEEALSPLDFQKSRRPFFPEVQLQAQLIAEINIAELNFEVQPLDFDGSKLYEELGIENSECDWFSFSEKEEAS